ncbi:uncharacterized protein UV8b_08119 [Ustilaginoidea virens]|uniref:GYF domain-containing protein n=1 Tax=Ustilaginoidea virens TaxID=1159556 RepID=A0A063CAI1_USTVR|nr:uncharacterized protein UV8b_08119 [Ustilaginoidea virens]QUC23878.1 hypothetical protein UV8b_08119 [Ustilaginoidea virens]GAO14253.1 hypothetical protein UVI_02001160 [Ustilaginoidea virens]
MSSRHSAARPNRDGENFARTHHNDANADNAYAKFDVRNPSILAPDSREDDAILEADVIGGRNPTKRGAVNLDGYDSDSDNETFNAKAAARKKGKVDINDQLDNYEAAGSAAVSRSIADREGEKKDEDEDDMFAFDGHHTDGVNGDQEGIEDDNADFDKSGKKKKDVRFLDSAQIMGQEQDSRSGGHIRLDDEESDDDEIEAQLAAEEEGLDEEVGAGGLKRNAPKIEAFNLKAEMEEGQFDQAGNYLRKAGDPDAVHDNWLDGLSKKDMKKAAEAHEKRAIEARKQRLEEADILVSDLLKALITRLEPSETPLEALARLGKVQPKTKKIPKWKLKKMNKSAPDTEMDTDAAEDPEQARVKDDINAVTDAADKLLSRDFDEVYDQDRELLIRSYRRETGEDWVEPLSRQKHEATLHDASNASKLWEFRWTDGRDAAAQQGPFDTATMKAWLDAGYFGQGVEFRVAGNGEDGWTTTASFV